MTRLEELCTEYRENARLVEELQALNEGLKADIVALMAGADTVTAGATKVTYKPYKSRRFDTKSFREEHAALYDEYTTETEYMRFTVK